MNIASSSGSGMLPSNTITNLKEDLMGITTQSGIAYKGPMIPTTSSPPNVVERETEVTKDMLPFTINGIGNKAITFNLDQTSRYSANYDVESINRTDAMTLELADRSITSPVGIAEDVHVKVGSFDFPADFVIVDFDADSRVPLILERSFLKTEKALIDVFEGELTLRVGKEAITFNLDQTSRYSANYNDMTAKRIDVINMACEEYSQEVLGFSEISRVSNEETNITFSTKLPDIFTIILGITQSTEYMKNKISGFLPLISLYGVLLNLRRLKKNRDPFQNFIITSGASSFDLRKCTHV
nr:reverse transcriptase domain-containing protein [Tanacetum cinerariifolium]